MKTVLFGIGARSQFIKCASGYRKLRDVASEILVHTGQHYDDSMSKVFFDDLVIPAPDYNLGVGSDRHGAQTGALLGKNENVLLDKGRTRSLFSATRTLPLLVRWGAAELHIPAIHVTTGFRAV